ncbi:21052_t:CDS:2, partial [Dentiscutata erythropus]
SWTIPEKIIDLEPAEVSKFQYIIGWTIYKLTKSDTSILAYKEFAKIKSCLDALSSEHVEYVYSTYSKTTTFNNLLQVAYELHYKSLPEFTNNYIQLSKKAEDYLLNVKAINADLKSNAKKDEKSKIKLVTFKKGILLEDLDLALCISKRASKDEKKKKTDLIDLLFNHLQNGSEFNKEIRKK